LDRVSKQRPQALERDLDAIARLIFPIAVLEAQFTRAEKMDMDIAGLSMLGEFEVVVFEVGQGMTHVAFTGKQVARIVEYLAVPEDSAAAVDVIERKIGH
jgi:hypothetical protein